MYDLRPAPNVTNTHDCIPSRALTSSRRIFCTMNVATVLDSSLPISMVRRHSGMISVDSRKLITSVSSTCVPSVGEASG